MLEKLKWTVLLNLSPHSNYHKLQHYIGAVLGSGILIIPGLVAEVSGPASLISWGLMIVVVLPMALTMGLLSAKYPNAGGVSHFVSKVVDINQIMKVCCLKGCYRSYIS
jgi:hypothetical protein